MDKQINLEIVTPDCHLFSGTVDMVIVRTTEGDIGVLFDHEPTVAPLTIGAIRLKTGESERIASCAGGFVNIEESLVTIITDAAEWAEDIDMARAEAARDRAQERLNERKSIEDSKDVDYMRAKIALHRAINRIRIVEKRV